MCERMKKNLPPTPPSQYPQMSGTAGWQCKPGEGSSLVGGTYQRRWVIPAYRGYFIIQICRLAGMPKDLK